MRPVLQVVVVSTRQGRVGPRVARWFADRARDHGGFEVEWVDLAEVGLPLFDEPRHPRLKQYEHEHTRRWSAVVDRADAFAFVTPEYNFSAPPSLVNAVDHLFQEWAYKPAGFVSYGGVSGGTRSVVMSKSVLTAMKVVPIPEAVTVPFVNRFLPEDGGPFAPEPGLAKAATSMLDELARWEGALRPLRRG